MIYKVQPVENLSVTFPIGRKAFYISICENRQDSRWDMGGRLCYALTNPRGPCKLDPDMTRVSPVDEGTHFRCQIVDEGHWKVIYDIKVVSDKNRNLSIVRTRARR